MKPRYKTAVDAALKLRKDLSITTPYIDVSNVCEKMGWRLRWSDAVDGDCEAVTIGYKGRPYIFLPAERKNPYRVKWSLSHECGHIVLKHFEDFDLSPIHAFDVGDTLIDTLDSEANAFAAELLIPKQFIVMNFHKGFEYLRKTCKVSNEALTNRLKFLGFLSMVEAAPTKEISAKEKAPKGAFGVFKGLSNDVE